LFDGRMTWTYSSYLSTGYKGRLSFVYCINEKKRPILTVDEYASTIGPKMCTRQQILFSFSVLKEANTFVPTSGKPKMRLRMFEGSLVSLSERSQRLYIHNIGTHATGHGRSSGVTLSTVGS
jgi:hypothetical protein